MEPVAVSLGCPPAMDRSLMLKTPHTLKTGLERADLEASPAKGEQQPAVLPSCEAREPPEQPTR